MVFSAEICGFKHSVSSIIDSLTQCVWKSRIPLYCSIVSVSIYIWGKLRENVGIQLTNHWSINNIDQLNETYHTVNVQMWNTSDLEVGFIMEEQLAYRYNEVCILILSKRWKFLMRFRGILLHLIDQTNLGCLLESITQS